MTARVSMLLKSRASLICFRGCFLPGLAKDLSAPRYSERVPSEMFITIYPTQYTIKYKTLFYSVLCFTKKESSVLMQYKHIHPRNGVFFSLFSLHELLLRRFAEFAEICKDDGKDQLDRSCEKRSSIT